MKEEQLIELIEKNNDDYWKIKSIKEMEVILKKKIITDEVIKIIIQEQNITLLKYINKYHNEKITLDVAKETLSYTDMLVLILDKFNSKELYELYKESIDNNNYLDYNPMKIILLHSKFDWNYYTPPEIYNDFIKSNINFDYSTYMNVVVEKSIILNKIIKEQENLR